MTKMQRHVITVPEETAMRIQVQKKERYFDKPYAVLYRDLIVRGLEEIEKETFNASSSRA